MASSVTRETFINAVRDALGFDRGGIDAFLKAINPATSAEDTAKASRPSSTGSADGDARDHHGGGSLDEASRAPVAPVPGWMPMLRVEKTECPACGARFDSIKHPTPAPVAPDREGLANALRVAWWGREDDKTTWGATPCDARSDWLRTADAAIAYFAKLGGAK